MNSLIPYDNLNNLSMLRHLANHNISLYKSRYWVSPGLRSHGIWNNRRYKSTSLWFHFLITRSAPSGNNRCGHSLDSHNQRRSAIVSTHSNWSWVFNLLNDPHSYRSAVSSEPRILLHYFSLQWQNFMVGICLICHIISLFYKYVNINNNISFH